MNEINNNTSFVIRLLEKNDGAALYSYLTHLSAESKSRFGPYAFDKVTIDTICSSLSNDILRFIALDNEQNIVAYMLIKQGMQDGERMRYVANGIYLDEAVACTYAPSVADAWQNAGLGTTMFNFIKNFVSNEGKKYMILWGGVQATNSRAVHFYKKHHFIPVANFWYDDKDNIDMYLTL
jgi:diamine N-acetyltransferase